MASPSSTSWIRYERRPCYVNEKRGMFHCWSNESYIVEPSMLLGGHGGGVVSKVLGIVELENGKVIKAYPENIRFADGGDFDECVFLPKEVLEA